MAPVIFAIGILLLMTLESGRRSDLGVQQAGRRIEKREDLNLELRQPARVFGASWSRHVPQHEALEFSDYSDTLGPQSS